MAENDRKSHLFAFAEPFASYKSPGRVHNGMQKDCDGIGQEAFGRDMLIPQGDFSAPCFTLARRREAIRCMHGHIGQNLMMRAMLLYHPIGKCRVLRRLATWSLDYSCSENWCFMSLR
jgi:hypothetical protein